MRKRNHVMSALPFNWSRGRKKHGLLVIALMSLLVPGSVSAQWLLSLTPDQERVANNRYASDRAGLVQPGQRAEISDQDNNGKISTGDSLVIRDSGGNVRVRRNLSEYNVYDLLLRSEIVNVARSIGTGWGFPSNGFVDINRAEVFNRPIRRAYQAPFNSGSGTETVFKQNQYWEMVQRGNSYFLLQREGVSASAAVDDLFNNRRNYRFDCSGVIPAIHLKAMLNLMGSDRFDRAVSERILISSFYDGYNPRYLNSNKARWDSGLGAWHVRNANAGEVVVNGRANLRGEMALFDPNAKNRYGKDELQIGTMYYFDFPGDNRTASQGWNTYYLGEVNGVHEFWATTVGVVRVIFQSGNWIPINSSAFSNHYLGAYKSSPDANLLRFWDTGNLAR